MRAKKLRDKAWSIAAYNVLCEEVTYDELHSMSDKDLTDIAWEPFEQWSAGELYAHIEQMAESIIREFGGKI